MRTRFLWTRTALSLNVVWFSCTLPFPRYYTLNVRHFRFPLGARVFVTECGILCAMLACVWSVIDGKRALVCGYVFVDKEYAFAPRGVVLVFIPVVTPSAPYRHSACAGVWMRFVDKECAFAHRGVVLVFIAVVLLSCGQWPRRAEICGGSTDAVPGQVVDMPVIVLTVVQMCRKLLKRFTLAVPGRCSW